MAWHIAGRKACFLHIPKTGGSWVHEALQVAGFKVVAIRSPESHVRHATWNHLRDTRLRFSIERTFTFVRHPVDWWKSVWRFVNTTLGDPARIDQHVWHPFHCAMLKRGTTFADFVQDVYSVQPAWFTRMVEWYVGPIGGEFVKHIGRQESLVADLLRILKEIEVGLVPNQVQKIKRYGKRQVNSTRQFGQVDCEPWLIDLIEQQERPVIERWYGDGFEGE